MPTRSRLALAQKLCLLRFIRGWSQEVLAELAGLHRTYISQIERGQVKVRRGLCECGPGPQGVPHRA